MSDGEGEFFWNKGESSGLGGMLRHEGRKRQMERRTINHPDGRQEIIETITENDYRTGYFSATNSKDYAIGAAAYERLNEAMARHDTPLHQLSNMKGELLRELQGSQNNVYQLKGQGK